MAMPRPEGMNSSISSSSSIWLMARDRAGGEICSSSAARRMLPVSATTEKYLILTMSMVVFRLTLGALNVLLANEWIK